MARRREHFENHLDLNGIYANNTLGTAGQVLKSDGENVYWGAESVGDATTLDGYDSSAFGRLAVTNTWALAQTFTVAPVFTDASGTRTALGLGTASTQNTGTTGSSIPVLNTANFWGATQTITNASAASSMNVGGATSAFEAQFVLRTLAGYTRQILFQSGTLNRWAFIANTAAEIGSNAGTNFSLTAYDDAGTSLGSVFVVNRSTRVLDFTVAPTFTDAATTRTNLGLGIGVGVQAWDADLDSWALITRAAGFDTFVATPSGANLATLLTSALPVSKGGTNATAAGITAFNNITGYTAAGATGTTSTNLVFSTSPTLVTPVLGAATATSINGLTLTSSTGTLTITNAKTLSVSNTLTLTATDGSTLAIGAGGTLASAAYVATGTSGATIPLLNGTNTWSGAQTFSLATTIGVGSAASRLALNGAAATWRYISGRTNGSDRWDFVLGNSVAESGSNAGSNIDLIAYNDSGVSLGSVFTVARATRVMNFVVAPTFTDAATTRTNLGLGIGVGVQAWDADLDSWALITRAAGFDTFVATPSGANLAALLTSALPVSKGGTNATAAGITAFNNITGYTAAGATGTTSTNIVFSTSPTLVSPVLGAATATSINGLSLTSSTGTITITNAKTLSVSNTLTLTATDGSTLAIGAGGTLASAAYVATGTSGATIPLLNGTNTWANGQTFTSTVVFSNVPTINAANPIFQFSESDQALDTKLWEHNVNGGVFTFKLVNDAYSAASTIFSVTRSTHLSSVFNFGSTVTLRLNDVAIPTISSTDTLSNKTLTSPTINSGTLNGSYGGTPTFGAVLTSSLYSPLGTGGTGMYHGFGLYFNTEWRNTQNSGYGFAIRNNGASGIQFVISTAAGTQDTLATTVIATLAAAAGTIWTSANLPTGTSGAVVPLLNGNNTYGGTAVFSSTVTLNSSLTSSSASPEFRLIETDAAVDETKWRFITAAGDFYLQALNDAEGVSTNPIRINRTGTVIDLIALTSTALTLNGIAIPTISSTDTFTNKTLTSPTINGATLSGTVTGSPLWTNMTFLNSPRIRTASQSGIVFDRADTTQAYVMGRSLATDNAQNFFLYDNIAGGFVFSVNSSRVFDFTLNPTANSIAIPTISSTDTLSNKTLTNPTINGATISGTWAGSATWSGTQTMSGLTARVTLTTAVSGTLTSAHANISVELNGNVTLNNSVFTAGDKTVFDPGTAARTFTRGAGVTMYVNGTDSATATLAANQIGGAHWRTASVVVLTGAFT